MNVQSEALTDTEKNVLNLLQKDFGFKKMPFAELASKLSLEESALISMVRDLKERGFITRIGPFFNLDRSSGTISLVAMNVPEDRFDEVAALVNAYPHVAHNYKRTHAFNMWFVLATISPEEEAMILSDIENKTGIKTMNLPKLKEYNLDLYLEV
jgi:DNA-binding Lrp family transcriptional regulator